ncbi:TPA: quinol oxidase [Streptococcus suis]
MTEVESSVDLGDKSLWGGRRHRSQRRKQVYHEFIRNVPDVPIWPTLLWSLFLSVLNVANPLLSSFATNLQSQALYAGMAMQAGHKPYEYFFGTNGVLYYLILAVGSLFNTTIGLMIFQFIALLIAGIYLNKISAYFSRSQRVAHHINFWFYCFLLVVDLGGLYASIFALPFVLTSIWFLIRYINDAVSDEGFILYGIDAAIVFMIYPKSLILWLVSPLVLFVYNSRNKRLARGVYQFLAAVFGFLLVVYTVGYYTFIEQILGMAIQQTFLYNISLQFTYEGILMTLAVVFGFLLISGFLNHILTTLLSISKGRQTEIKLIMLLAFLVQMVFLIGNPNFEWSQLTSLIPYGFVLAAASLHGPETDEEFEMLDEEENEDYSYLKASYYLPILMLLALFFQPTYAYLFEEPVRVERQEIARYIRDNTTSDDPIYAWDNSAQAYLESQRLSSANLITAQPYLNTEDNRNNLIYDLNQGRAKYILVNTEIPLLEQVSATLEDNYVPVQLSFNHFKLYQEKE